MQASKNGFFYVLDAKTGTVHFGEQLRHGQLGERLRPEDGTSDRESDARYDVTGKAAHRAARRAGRARLASHVIQPADGARVFLRRRDRHFAVKSDRRDYKPEHMGANTGLRSRVPPKEIKVHLPREARSQLVAWDPVNQREVWRSPVLGTIGGGTLATAGGLVFQGTNKGRFVAYRASDGQELWSMERRPASSRRPPRSRSMASSTSRSPWVTGLRAMARATSRGCWCSNSVARSTFRLLRRRHRRWC